MNNNKIVNVSGNNYLYMSEYNQIINSCIKDLFLENGANRKISIRDADTGEERIKKRVSTLLQMTFEITENCNLRCKYCVYNGSYRNWRKLSPRAMSFATARKGLDYVFSLISGRKKKKFYLGFYGGEPLLNIKTIKKIIEYGKKRMPGWHLGFNMTTNLTLLDEATLDFLEENDFLLLVSLDGGRENHDAKRVFANDSGTFDTVLKNLEKIAGRCPDYFQRKVSFSAVFSPDLSFKSLYQFFSGSDLIKNLRLRLSMVGMKDTTYYEEYPYSGETYQQEVKEVFLQVLEKVRRGEELTGLDSFIYNDFKRIAEFLETRRSTHMDGTCLFDDRLFLDTRGRFHICERINNTLPIGDVDQGFDFKKMAAIARQYCKISEEYCSDCNIRFLCKRCYINFAGDGKLKLDPKFCEIQRESVFKNLGKYIECKEEGLV